jgi:8-oxo-dGTP diphosphatase
VVILLVRHGHAGTRAAWRGDDRLRPLSTRGRAEAQALITMLSPFGPARIVTSPTVRCLQTVEPLAAHLRLDIETTEHLAPEATDISAIIEGLARTCLVIVACTHGEVIEAAQRHLPRDSSVSFGPDQPTDKGSVWVLHVADGRLTDAEYRPPGGRRSAPARGWAEHDICRNPS